MKLLNILLSVVLTVSATVAQAESALWKRNTERSPHNFPKA